jgi:hypothetical protein
VETLPTLEGGPLLDGALLDGALLDGALLDGALLDGALLDRVMLDRALLGGALVRVRPLAMSKREIVRVLSLLEGGVRLGRELSYRSTV